HFSCLAAHSDAYEPLCDFKSYYSVLRAIIQISELLLKFKSEDCMVDVYTHMI
ncbi:hypothetical protein J2S21_001976, partial [Peribacillus cavernae]|nr:hypothetical protein [Peribacillus cavernae]